MAIHEGVWIHPTVRVHPSNKIEPNVIIKEGVTLGTGNHVMPNAYIGSGTTIGNDNEIHMGAVIGHVPQDLSFRGEPSFTVIGHRNKIREHVTIHRGSEPGSVTRIGNDCFFMAGSHVAHNCQVGNGVTLVNNCALGGHVEVGDRAVLSAGSVIHQCCRVGELVMVSAFTAANKDIPPYMIARGNRLVMATAVNVVGLRRAGLSAEARRKIHDAYKVLYRSGLPVADALELLSEDETEEIQKLVHFIRESQRGIISGPNAVDRRE